MQNIADDVADNVGVEHTPMGIKGNKPGATGADLDQDSFTRGVHEKNARKKYKSVGDMADMSRGRFDLDAEVDAQLPVKSPGPPLYAKIGQSTEEGDEFLELMQGALDQNRPLQVGSRTLAKDPKLKAAANAKNVIGNQAYAVQSVDFDEFKKMYKGVRVGGFWCARWR